jgi:hypothetical protein
MAALVSLSLAGCGDVDASVITYYQAGMHHGFSTPVVHVVTIHF